MDQSFKYGNSYVLLKNDQNECYSPLHVVFHYFHTETKQSACESESYGKHRDVVVDMFVVVQ